MRRRWAWLKHGHGIERCLDPSHVERLGNWACCLSQRSNACTHQGGVKEGFKPLTSLHTCHTSHATHGDPCTHQGGVEVQAPMSCVAGDGEGAGDSTGAAPVNVH